MRTCARSPRLFTINRVQCLIDEETKRQIKVHPAGGDARSFEAAPVNGAEEGLSVENEPNQRDHVRRNP